MLPGFGFMFSPVVSALGVGFLGLEFSKGLPVTVTVAHAAFGLALGWLTGAWLGFVDSSLLGALHPCLPKRPVTQRPSH